MKQKPLKSLTKTLKRTGGRSASGRVSMHHIGGRAKRDYREIDFKRNKEGIVARVSSIEYDPNRTVDIALLVYKDGEKRYILSPDGLKVGAELNSGPDAEIKIGNNLPLLNIPVGLPIHNLEIMCGKGGQIARGAGDSAVILSKNDGFAEVRLPSGRIRRVPLTCHATIGQLGNLDHKNRKLGKAGLKRHMGIRPTVRGVAQNPHSHPHGGGEGRSGVGMPSPLSPWGKKTLGKKTRRPRKYSDSLLLRKRN